MLPLGKDARQGVENRGVQVRETAASTSHGSITIDIAGAPPTEYLVVAEARGECHVIWGDPAVPEVFWDVLERIPITPSGFDEEHRQR